MTDHRIALLTFALFVVLLPRLAIAQDGNILADRLRIEVVRVEEEPKSLGQKIVYYSQLLKLHAGGIIRPPEGTTYHVTAVAYSSTTDQTDRTPCWGAGGPVGSDVVATNFLPLGTRLRISEKTYVVRDRMNAKYNGKYIVDIWHPTRREALAFGSQNLKIEILDYEEPKKKSTADDEQKEETSSATPEPAALPSPPPTGFFAQFRESLRKLAELFQRFVSGRALPKDVDCLSENN